MPIDAHHFLVADSYSPPSTFDHSLVMSFADSRHNFTGPSPPNSSASSSHSSMFSIPEHSTEHPDFTNSSASPYPQHGHFADSHHRPSSQVDHTVQQLTLNPAHLTSQAGHAVSNRVLTRAQARAASQQQLLARQTDQQSMQGHGLANNTRKDEINGAVRVVFSLFSSFSPHLLNGVYVALP